MNRIVIVVLGGLLLGSVAHADPCWVTTDNGTQLQDSDCDGIIDKVDSCPKPDQKDANGNAMDTDSDDVQDACDNCISTPNPKQWNPKDSKQWQPDSDGDGIGDACDNCPKVSNADQKDANGSGIGDVCECAPDEESNPLTPGPKDVCQSATVLLEYSCDKGKQLTIPAIECSIYSNIQQDSVCEKGACVFKPKSGGPPPPKPVCGYYDTDKDGLGDECDNCPFKPNADQKDANGDGIGDACDPASTANSGDTQTGTLPGSSGGGGGPDGPKCKEDPTSSHSDNPVATVSTLNLFASTRVTAGSATIDIIAGEGGNVLWRSSSKPVWAKFHNPWDDNPQIKLLTMANYKRDVTALWSSGATTFATTVGGYLFKVTVDGAKPGDSIWQVMGFNDVSGAISLGNALYAVHGISPNDFFVAGRNGALWHFSKGKWQSAQYEAFIASTIKLLQSGWLCKFIPGTCNSQTGKPLPANMTTFDKLGTVTWRGVQMLSDGSVWVVGDGGRIVHKLADGTWLDVSLSAKTDLRAVWANAQELYIGGGSGKIFCNPQAITQCAQLDMGSTLFSIAGDGSNNLIAVGNRGVLATKTGNDPKSWTPQAMPVSNSLLTVAGSASSAMITGVNGTVYDWNSGDLKSEMLLRKDVAHPEWTGTQWTVMLGAIDKKGSFDGPQFFAGDDLAVVQLNPSTSPWKWELLSSDDEVVPFKTPYSMSHRTIRDLTRVENIFYGVGNFDFFIKGNLAKAWEKIPLVVKKKVATGFYAVDFGSLLLNQTPPPSPDMKSARPGPAKTVLMAGSLGVFQYDPATGSVTTLEKGDSAVAMTVKNNAIWALTTGLDGGIVAPWTGNPSLTPEDISAVGDTIAVVGQEIVKQDPYLNPAFIPQPPWHYMSYKDGKWQDNAAMVPADTGVHRLKSFSAKVYLMPGDPMNLQGMAILGDHELVEIETGGGVYQLGYKPASSDAWFDGNYNYDYWLDLGITESTAAFRVDVMGVGSYNRIQHFAYKYQCTVSVAEALDYLKKKFGF